MVADSCPKLAMLAQPPLHDFLRRSGLTWAQWIAQPGRTLWGPCTTTSAVGRLSRQNYHCMVAGVELEKHFNFRMVWEYLDVMMRLSGEGGRVRAAPLQSSLDYRNAHSCLPTQLISNSDATEYFYGYVSMKIGVWSFIFGIMPKWGCKSSCTTGTKITLTLSRKHWQNISISVHQILFQAIQRSSAFCGGGWSVKYDVKESSPFSSQVMMGWRRIRKDASGHEKRSLASSKMSNQRNTHTQSWRSLGKLVATYYFATSLFGTDLYLGAF